MNTTPFKDKQIVDLSQGSSQLNNEEFIDLMKMSNNPHEEEHPVGHANGLSKKEEILPNYDFQPIRPVVGASSQSPRFDATPILHSVWSSADSKSNTSSPIGNYGSLNSIEPAKVILEKDRNVLDATIVSEIDRTMKKHADSLLHVLEGVSARLTQLDSRTRHLENSVDDLKTSVGNNHGNSDAKMRQLENILRDVQTGVQVLKDKQTIVEAQLQLAKMQVSDPKVVPQSESQNAMQVDSGQTVASAPQQSHQYLPTPVNLPPSFPAASAPNAPPQPIPQSVPPSVQHSSQFSQNHSSQFSQNQIPPPPQRDPYFAAPSQTQESPNQQYQLPPGQQPVAPPTVPSHQQFQPTSQPQYSQPPPQMPQQHPSHAPVNNPSQLQPTSGHHAEETPYVPSQNYSTSVRQPHSQTPSGLPSPQQYYVPSFPAYEPPSGKSSSGFSSGYGPPSGPGEPYHYGVSPSQYGGTSSMKPQQLSSATSQSGGSGYPQLPTARVLPHALPAASGASGSGSVSGSGGTGKKVPIDDVIDKVTSMGFPRDHVRATVRKLTDNGQSVDLNVVLDKLMNDGEVQPPRGGSFGR